jgi:hypothetical protein
LIATPTMIWQQLHDWPQLRMTPVVAGEAQALYGGRTGIAVELLVFAGLAGVVLGIYGLVRLLLADELRTYRYLGVTFLALYAVFVATAGRPYYLVGLYAPLAACGALGLQRRREAGGAPRRWVVWPAWLAATFVAVGALVVSVSITRSDVGENIARRTAEAYRALPAAQRDRTVIIGESYIVAAFSTAAHRSTTCRPRTAPVAATATFPHRQPTMTWCSTSGASRIACARTSTTPAASATWARTCTPSSSPARPCRGKPCGPG